MAVNKNALIRYQFLDKCFSDFNEKYYFDDILILLNDRLSNEDNLEGGVKVRQLRDDIRFMKSDEGYAAPIIAYKEGRKAYYRYEDKSYSILKAPLNEEEKEQLKDSFQVLERFKGSSSYNWIHEIGPLIQNQFNLYKSDHCIMSVDRNYHHSYIHVQELLNAIVAKQVLKINYTNVNGENVEAVFHPYFLKKYASQWFVFGRNEVNFDNKYCIPLDQISSISIEDTHYLQTKMDWEAYFKDIIGVTQTNDPVQEILLKVDASYAAYISADPIHSSQKENLKDDGSLEVTIKVKPNVELEMRILAFGEFVEVVFSGFIQA